MTTRPVYFWAPGYALAVAITALVHPASVNAADRAEAWLWSLGYPLLSYALGYWAVRWTAKTAHPAWRVVGALAVFALQLLAGLWQAGK